MKMKLIPFVTAAVFFASCGNQSTKDSVDKADSANAAKTDTSSSSGKSDSSASTTTPIKADEATTTFLVKAANGGMAEVALSQLAKEKSKDSSIVHFADMMLMDHGDANAKVKTLAAERNVTLPAEPDADHKKKADDLGKKTGKDFDKGYVDAMVKDHTETVDLFKKASGDVKYTPVKTFIDNTLPVIEQHLARVKEIKKGMK